MIWAILAFLGIPLWFIAAILIGVFHNRKQVRSSPGVFRFYDRTDGGWSRRAGYARWVSDVFIVHKGVALVRTDAKQATNVDVNEHVDDPPKKLDSAIELDVTFADSISQTIAVSADDLDTARGDRTTKASE